MSRASPGLRNIGPKSAAWLRQVGLRTREDLAAVGPVEAWLRVKRAGFKPSSALLYALEGALQDCHWQQVPPARREQLLADAQAGLPAAAKPGPVRTIWMDTAVEKTEDAGPDADTDAGLGAFDADEGDSGE